VKLFARALGSAKVCLVKFVTRRQRSAAAFSSATVLIIESQRAWRRAHSTTRGIAIACKFLDIEGK
jgi:hypothetical protein